MADKKDSKKEGWSVGTMVFVALAAIAGVVLMYFIFSPQPEKDLDLQTGTVVDMGWKTYHSDVYGFDVQYPPLYRVDDQYADSTLGSGQEMRGVAFYIPQSMDVRTNLSNDSRITVERLPGATCTAAMFMNDPHEKDAAVIGDREFSYAESSDAGAGNLYDQYVYAIPNAAGSQCFAVRLFLHSTQIANYEPGTVKAFDREGLIKTVRDMAGTLVVR
jgi:hypothetical protein